MNRRFFIYFYVFIFIAAAGCGSTVVRDSIVNEAEEVKIGGEFLLHENPQKGDYAVYKVLKAVTVGTRNPEILKVETVERYEVISVSKDLIKVSVKKTVARAECLYNGRPLQYSHEREIYLKMGTNEDIYYLSPGGQIQKTVLVNRDHGITREYQKAEPGHEGFLKYSDPEADTEISTAAGKFQAGKIICRYPILTMKKFDDSRIKGYWVKKGQAEITAYISPDVKFKKVRSGIKSEYDRLVDTMIAGANGTWIAKKGTGHRSTEITEELIEQGRK